MHGLLYDVLLVSERYKAIYFKMGMYFNKIQLFFYGQPNRSNTFSVITFLWAWSLSDFVLIIYLDF